MSQSRRLFDVLKAIHMAEQLAGIKSEGTGWYDMISGICFKIIGEG